jgi:hypothetical protein
MKPTSFKETNQVLMAGDNPNTDQLPVCYATNPEIPDRVFIVSRWKLSPEELERINETGELWISVMNRNMAPIMPTVFDPFYDHGYKPIDLD